MNLLFACNWSGPDVLHEFLPVSHISLILAPQSCRHLIYVFMPSSLYGCCKGCRFGVSGCGHPDFVHLACGCRDPFHHFSCIACYLTMCFSLCAGAVQQTVWQGVCDNQGFPRSIFHYWVESHEPHEKTLPSQGYVVQAAVVDEGYERFVVSYELKLLHSIKVSVKLFTRPHTSQSFLFNLGIARFCFAKPSGARCHRFPLLHMGSKQHASQSATARISQHSSWLAHSLPNSLVSSGFSDKAN